MQRVALRTGPGRARPDHRFAGAKGFLGRLKNGLVVEQRVEVMHCLRRDAMVARRRRGAFTKIGLNRRCPKRKQILELLLDPGNPSGMRIIEQTSILNKAGEGMHIAIRTLSEKLARLTFHIQWRPNRVIRPLPERNAKALLAQPSEHAGSVGKASGAKRQIADPLILEPAGIDMDHITRNVVGAQIVGHLFNFGLAAVRNACHPQAEAPARWHARHPRDCGIAGEDIG